MADDSEEDELDVGGGADRSSGLTHKQREERRLAAFCWLDRPLPPGYSSVLVKVGSNDATTLSLDESKHTVVERIEGESLVKHFFGVKQFTQIRTDATLADWRDPYDTTDGAAYTLSFTDLPNAPELYSEPKRMYQSYLDRPFKAVAKLPAAGSPKRVRAEWMSLLCKAKITVVRASFDNFARCDFETVPEFLADGAADERAIDILRTWLEAHMHCDATELTEEMVTGLALPVVPLLGKVYDFYRAKLTKARKEQQLLISFMRLALYEGADSNWTPGQSMTGGPLGGLFIPLEEAVEAEGADAAGGEGAAAAAEGGGAGNSRMLDSASHIKATLLARAIFQGVFVKAADGSYIERPGLDSLADWATSSTKAVVGQGREAAPSGKQLRVLPKIPSDGLKIQLPEILTPLEPLQLSPVATAIALMSWSDLMTAIKRIKALLPVGNKKGGCVAYPAETVIIRREAEKKRQQARVKRRRTHSNSDALQEELEATRDEMTALGERMERREALVQQIIAHMDNTATGAHYKRVYAKLLASSSVAPAFTNIQAPNADKLKAAIWGSYVAI